MTKADKQFESAIAAARDLGRRAGAGSDHDCDLSGEWADRPGGPEVYRTILEAAGVAVPAGEDWLTELLDAYEEAYNQAATVGRYGDHRISLEYEQVNLGGFAYTNWVLFVDGHLLYLGQDSKFVTRVLGQDFAQFLHAAFERADLRPLVPNRELTSKQRDLLRASLAAGIVRALDDVFSEQGRDFFEAVANGDLEPWSFAN